MGKPACIHSRGLRVLTTYLGSLHPPRSFPARRCPPHMLINKTCQATPGSGRTSWTTGKPAARPEPPISRSADDSTRWPGISAPGIPGRVYGSPFTVTCGYASSITRGLRHGPVRRQAAEPRPSIAISRPAKPTAATAEPEWHE